MTIKFLKNIDNLKHSVEIVEELLPQLSKTEMFYYFPFETNRSLEVNVQIDLDIDEFNFINLTEAFLEKWNEYELSILNSFENFTNINNIETETEFNCYLTIYGPYGYYNVPNEIFVNVSKKFPEFQLETLVHEILHLAIDNSSSQEKVSESKVDDLFIEFFGHIFPKYLKQKELKK